MKVKEAPERRLLVCAHPHTDDSINFVFTLDGKYITNRVTLKFNEVGSPLTAIVHGKDEAAIVVDEVSFRHDCDLDHKEQTTS
jgi:hypothetical protein